ncbi:MAG TPA: response regulator transcription factor, partial [Anaerolineales bacterium]|nr:response regulator transcription factor [Anaerolineales bacterium]
MKSNILVVDDEPVARQSLTDILRLEGFSVNSVPNGQAAVEYVRTNAVELIVVDLRMPGMDGLEVIQVVNQISPETEVILLTAFGTTETAIQALRLRVHDYLLKPAPPAQVVSSVKKGLVRREARLKARGGGISSMDVDEGISDFSLKDGTHIDLSRRQIRKKDQIVHLTPAEGRLLKVLIDNPGRVYSHRE